MSDHLPYFYSIQTDSHFQKQTKKFIYSRNFNKDTFNEMYQYLNTIDFNSILKQEMMTDPNINYNILDNILVHAINNYMPLKKIKFNKHKHKRKKFNWITQGIIKSIQFRDNLYKNMKQAIPSTFEYLHFKQKFKAYSTILKKLIREAKFNFYKDKFIKYCTDPHKTSSIINDAINKPRSKQSVDYLNINDGKHSDKQLIANHFNTYFSEIGTKLALIIPVPDNILFTDYLTSEINTTFSFETVSQEKVQYIIENLHSKQSSGVDGISSILLKQLAPILCKPLTLILNQPLLTGIFPDKLKLAKVIPVHKRDDTRLTENYRPISILPSISKVFEKSVFDQIYIYFVQHKYLSEIRIIQLQFLR